MFAVVTKNAGNVTAPASCDAQRRVRWPFVAGGSSAHGKRMVAGFRPGRRGAANKTRAQPAAPESSEDGADASARGKGSLQGSAAAKAAERRRSLRQRKEERNAQLQLQVGEWFESFDEDRNKQLDRNELRKLLLHLHPDTPVEDEALDYLIKKATEIVSPSLTIEGSADGMIPWVDAVKTVTRYSSYLKNKRSLDELLKRFDSNGNGKLETSELAALLRAPRPAHAPLRCPPEPPSPGAPRLAMPESLCLSTV